MIALSPNRQPSTGTRNWLSISWPTTSSSRSICMDEGRNTVIADFRFPIADLPIAGCMSNGLLKSTPPIANRQSKIGNASPYPRHLLPEKLADFCERGEKAFVAFRIAGFSRQAKIGSQLGIGRRDIFIATLAGKPAIKSTRNGASLFKRRFADKRTAQIVHVGQLELVRIVVAPQGREEFFVAQKLSQSLKHQGALARNNRVVLQ